MPQALFPGRDYLQQLRLIIEALGPPSDEDLNTINNPQARARLARRRGRCGGRRRRSP